MYETLLVSIRNFPDDEISRREEEKTKKRGGEGGRGENRTEKKSREIKNRVSSGRRVDLGDRSEFGKEMGQRT